MVSITRKNNLLIREKIVIRCLLAVAKIVAIFHWHNGDRIRSEIDDIVSMIFEIREEEE